VEQALIKGIRSMLDLRIERIVLKQGRTDMRKSIKGLAIMAQEVMRENPLSGNLFLFCNGSRTRLKLLLLGCATKLTKVSTTMFEMRVGPSGSFSGEGFKPTAAAVFKRHG
jgi:hypothetical protein